MRRFFICNHSNSSATVVVESVASFPFFLQHEDHPLERSFKGQLTSKDNLPRARDFHDEDPWTLQRADKNAIAPLSPLLMAVSIPMEKEGKSSNIQTYKFRERKKKKSTFNKVGMDGYRQMGRTSQRPVCGSASIILMQNPNRSLVRITPV